MAVEAPEVSASSPPVVARVVPGAPPKPSLSKSQKKRRKNAKSAEDDIAGDNVETSQDAALVDHVPSTISSHLVDPVINEGAPAVVPVTQIAEQSQATSGADLIIQKRIKHLSKKLQRIQTYSHKDVSELNEDQKRSLASLNGLESSVKELEEVRKLAELYEAERAQNLKVERLSVIEQERSKIADAVSFAEAQHLAHTRSLVAFLALSTVLVAPITIGADHLSHDHRIPSEPAEKEAVIRAGQVLLTPEFGGEEKDSLMKGLLGYLPEGSFQGIDYSRLRQIADHFIHPPTPIPSPPLAAMNSDTDLAVASQQLSDVTHISAPTAGTAETTPTQPFLTLSTNGLHQPSSTSSLQFIGASDLDAEEVEPVVQSEVLPTSATEEWIQVSDEKHSLESPKEEVKFEEKLQSAPVESGSVAFDWASADHEDALPPLADNLVSSPLLPTEESSTSAADARPVSTETGRQFGRGRGRGGRRGGPIHWGPPQPDSEGFITPRSGRSDSQRAFRSGPRGRRPGPDGEQGPSNDGPRRRGRGGHDREGGNNGGARPHDEHRRESWGGEGNRGRSNHQRGHSGEDHRARGRGGRGGGRGARGLPAQDGAPTGALAQ